MLHIIKDKNYIKRVKSVIYIKQKNYIKQENFIKLIILL